ncbi:unnamed protein product [Caenorhabditis auriculariae]|uniref:SCP domain-containing protein n=1 Tax=Caenorhabditis auriculariae TaxID=2777116 RepID=A0A8S1H9F3_9PELO|nr:unnamed protein product [Caenorhabditis auriculariae]
MVAIKLLTAIAVLGVGSLAQFTDKQKQIFLDHHNKVRSDIALGKYVARGVTKPPATNMYQLVWDDEVATQAQAYAETCPTGHSHRKGVGENIYWQMYMPEPDNYDEIAEAASVMWADEFQEFGWPSNTLTYPLFNSGIGHATQVAWADTHAMGCGYHFCPEKDDRPDTLAVICQYKDQGNVIGADIYESGKTCSKCPKGSTCVVATGLWIRAEFTENGKERILQLHNRIRSDIAMGKYVTKGILKPPAMNMFQLNWNETLAQSAQNYAGTCIQAHSHLRGVGENLYFGMDYISSSRSAEFHGLRAAELWISEFQDLGWPSNILTSELFNSGIGHATQMAWASTSSIGCGINSCRINQNWSIIHVVCHYSPPGNIIGAKIYEEGKTNGPLFSE